MIIFRWCSIKAKYISAIFFPDHDFNLLLQLQGKSISSISWNGSSPFLPFEKCFTGMHRSSYDPVIHHKRSPAINWEYCIQYSLLIYHYFFFISGIPQLRMDDIPILLRKYGRLLSTWDVILPFCFVGAFEHVVVLGRHFLIVVLNSFSFWPHIIIFASGSNWTFETSEEGNVNLAAYVPFTLTFG